MYRYPVLRLLGVAAALALYIAAGVFTGYPGRLVPLGAVLASCFSGRYPSPGADASLAVSTLALCFAHGQLMSSINRKTRTQVVLLSGVSRML